MKNEKGNALVGFVLLAVLAVAWLTHITICFKTGAWGFLIAGAIFFPIGILHGVGIWFGWW